MTSQTGGAKKADRRVQRTRTALRDALIALVLEKGYDAVTVQDIIDRANVGRSTFYAHFLDKEHLFLSGFEQVSETLTQQRAGSAATGARRLSFSLEAFEHVQAHLRLYRALVGKRSGAVAAQRMQELLANQVRDDLASLAPDGAATPVPRELVVQYTVSTFMELLVWWADHEPAYTAAQMDAMFQRLTLPGVLAGLGVGRDMRAIR